MPRTLPWTRATAPASKASNPTSSPAGGERPSKRRKESGIKVNSNTTVAPSRSLLAAKKPNRTPSTSPPPAPPSQEPMRPSDSDWIMVEDELYAVAQSFTKHLHWSEYKRLKERAAQKRTDIAVIDRPVDEYSKMSMERKLQKKHQEKRQEVADTSRAMKANNSATTSKDQDSDEDKDVVIGDRNLAGLMLIAGKTQNIHRTVLQGSFKPTNSRAAAGFAKQKAEKRNRDFSARLYDIPGVKTEEPERTRNSMERDLANNNSDWNAAEDDDVDLDLPLPAIRKAKNVSTAPVKEKPTAGLPSRALLPSREESTVTSYLMPTITLPHGTSTFTSNSQAFLTAHPVTNSKPEIPTFDDFPQSKALTAGILERAKARALMKKAGNEKSVKLDEIPTFMM